MLYVLMSSQSERKEKPIKPNYLFSLSCYVNQERLNEF